MSPDDASRRPNLIEIKRWYQIHYQLKKELFFTVVSGSAEGQSVLFVSRASYRHPISIKHEIWFFSKAIVCLFSCLIYFIRRISYNSSFCCSNATKALCCTEHKLACSHHMRFRRVILSNNSFVAISCLLTIAVILAANFARRKALLQIVKMAGIILR